jgi:uncharacterized protein
VTYRVVVIAGRGRYEDPWHDHAATCHQIALVLAELGEQFDVEVRGAFPDAFNDLARVDLLVVNSGSGRADAVLDGADVTWLAVHERVHAFARNGGAVLGLHQAANTFADSSYWAKILGGRWVPGISTHPPIGDCTINVRTGIHPITQGLGDINLFDERYCDLWTAPGVQVLATHEEDGRDHPVVWVNTSGGYRSVYDALGHDVRALESRGRRRLLRREALWLLGEPVQSNEDADGR